MFFTKKEEKSGWEIKNEFLIFYKNDGTMDQYRLGDLYACYSQRENRVCFWFENAFLVNCKCSEGVFRKIVQEHGVFECDDYVPNILVSDFVSLDGDSLAIQKGTLIVDNESFDLSSIRLSEPQSGYFLIKNENDIEIATVDISHFKDFKCAMETSIQQMSARLTGKALEKHLQIQFDRELLEVQQEIADRNRKISESGYSHIILTTEAMSPFEVEERLGIITAECVYGMNIFYDFFAAISDIVGGRSNITQNLLKSARENVLLELRKEAFERGGDAVVAVDLDYSEFSGAGKSMLFIVASGTVIKIKKQQLSHQIDDEN